MKTSLRLIAAAAAAGSVLLVGCGTGVPGATGETAAPRSDVPGVTEFLADATEVVAPYRGRPLHCLLGGFEYSSSRVVVCDFPRFYLENPDLQPTPPGG